jgi:CHASE2 domain-containing sensor protein
MVAMIDNIGNGSDQQHETILRKTLPRFFAIIVPFAVSYLDRQGTKIAKHHNLQVVQWNIPKTTLFIFTRRCGSYSGRERSSFARLVQFVTARQKAKTVEKCQIATAFLT